MSINILVLTNDGSWRARVVETRLPPGVHVAFGRGVNTLKESIAREADLFLIDAELLPPPESKDLNRIHRAVGVRPMIAVYTPGTEPTLPAVRSSFKAGAVDLVEKPYTPGEFKRLFSSSEVAPLLHPVG